MPACRSATHRAFVWVCVGMSTLCVCMCVCVYCSEAPIGVGHALSCLTFQLTRILTLGT